ncbi:MAG: ubiquinol-cytochrome c reductase cytochrome b subunit [Anaerolineaceae bacterium]|nr:MAG: ubiquinol-cytochrome c reductase cytochrome b subunit [Anaerolineaceae bacterium]
MDTTHPETEKDSIPFYPDHVRTEFYVMVGIIVLAIIVGILGLMFPIGLQEPADPLNTPLHVKPEWYFLFLYQILAILPPTILGIEGTAFSVVSVMIALVVVTLWPFFDRKEDTSKTAAWVRVAVTILGLLTVIALTIWGEVS